MPCAIHDQILTLKAKQLSAFAASWDQTLNSIQSFLVDNMDVFKEQILWPAMIFYRGHASDGSSLNWSGEV